MTDKSVPSSVMDFGGRARQKSIYTNGVFGRKPVVPTDFSSLAEKAQKNMSPRAWAYIAGGAGQENTMTANREALNRWKIVPRVLNDVSQRSLETEVFGNAISAPIAFAPVGAGQLVRRDSDLFNARAAAKLGVPYIISNQGCSTMEEISAAMEEVSPGAPRWFQLYWSTDDGLVDSLISRAEKCGAAALVVTLDTTLLGWRPMDLNIGSLPFSRAEGIAQYTSDPRFNEIVLERVRLQKDSGERAQTRVTLSALKTLASMAREVPGGFFKNLAKPTTRAAVETFLEIYSRPSLTWENIAELRGKTRLPIVLKGINHPEDAQRAVELGVAGVYVSNHGGRQIDGGISSADALSEVAQAVGGQATVLVDSGFYSGADVFKGLALGADVVCIGRPMMYGLAIEPNGAYEVAANIIAELDLTLALSGFTNFESIRGKKSKSPVLQEI